MSDTALLKGALPLVQLGNKSIAVIAPVLDNVITEYGDLSSDIITSIKSATNKFLNNPYIVPVGGTILASSKLELGDAFMPLDTEDNYVYTEDYPELSGIITPENIRYYTPSEGFFPSGSLESAGSGALNLNVQHTLDIKGNYSYKTPSHITLDIPNNDENTTLYVNQLYIMFDKFQSVSLFSGKLINVKVINKGNYKMPNTDEVDMSVNFNNGKSTTTQIKKFNFTNLNTQREQEQKSTTASGGNCVIVRLGANGAVTTGSIHYKLYMNILDSMYSPTNADVCVLPYKPSPVPGFSYFMRVK